jgi:adenosylhomocysteine nucleosidase
MRARPLVAVALAEEAAHLSGVRVVLTGPGKVAAATSIAAAIAEERPSMVLNVGTAGALRPQHEGVYRIGRVIEHDLDHLAIEVLTGSRFPNSIDLDPGSDIVLATGDVFVQDDDVRTRLAEHAHLVDMEGYAVARACLTFGVPCTMLKVVSDEASTEALASWRSTIAHAARSIASAVEQHLASQP